MSILNLLIIFSLLSSALAGQPCPSPQYLQLGATGLINCTFEGDFTVIAWFNSTSTQDDHIALIRKSGKSVDGSGEFDIAQNGSLLIMNVSLQHGHTFCVVTIGTGSSPPSYCTDVVTVVFPEQREPLITDVRNCSEGVCFAQYFEDSTIRCSVENTRPAINLTWAVRSGLTDQTIPHQSSMVPSSISGASSSSVRLLDPFKYSKTLALVVCKGNSQPNMLKRNESLILLQNMKSDLSSVTPDPLYAAVKSTVVLNCPNMEKHLLVWNQKRRDSQNMNLVAFAVFGESLFVSPTGEKLTLNPDGSLVISEVSVQSRGIYICIAGNGEHEEAQSYDVHVYAPAFPEVEGCESHSYCVLLAEESDKLTCAIRGVPEGVRLGFSQLSPQGASITFLEQVVEIRDAGDFVDVSVTATYHASGSGISTFQCSVIGEHKELFNHTAVFSLFVEPAINTTPHHYEFDFGRTAFIILVAVLALGSLAWIRLYWLCSVRRGDTPSKEAQSSEADIVERQPCMLMSEISIQHSEGLRANSFNC